MTQHMRLFDILVLFSTPFTHSHKYILHTFLLLLTTHTTNNFTSIPHHDPLTLASNMNGVKQELGLKSDPDTKSPGGFIDDDDIYEDTGELNMPPKGVDNELWLTRIPKWLWEALESTGEGDDVEVGRIAVVTDPKTGKPSKDHPMRIFFNDNWYHTTKVPRAYDLTPAPQADQPANTYVFTEKDLPGYKPMLYGRGRIDVPQAVQDPKARVQKRGKYRKAIPSTYLLQNKPISTPR